MLAGERASALGDETTGLRAVDLHPFPAVRALQAGLPPAERVKISPGAALRSLAGPGRRIESVLVFRRLPATVLQWRSDALDDPPALRLAWESPATPDAVPPGDPGAPELRLPLRDGSTDLVARLSGGTARWKLSRAGAGGSRAVRIGLLARPTGSDPLTLALYLDREGEGVATAALRRRLGNLDGVLAVWAGEARRESDEGLVLQAAPPADIDRPADIDPPADTDPPAETAPTDGGAVPGRAVAWARRRLERSLARPQGRRPAIVAAGFGAGCGAATEASTPHRTVSTPDPAPVADAVWAGHGLLAVGRHAEAREVAVGLLERLGTPEGSVRNPTLEVSLALHLAARWTLWTGSTDVLRHADAVLTERLPDLEDAAGEPVGPGSAPTRTFVSARSAVAELAEAYECGKDLPMAAALQHMAEGLAPDGERHRPTSGDDDPARGSASLSLPVVDGRGSAPSEEAAPGPFVPPPPILAAVLGHGETAPRRIGRNGSAIVGSLRSGGSAAEEASPSATGADAGSLAERAFRAWAAWEEGDAATAHETWLSVLGTGAPDVRTRDAPVRDAEGRDTLRNAPSGEPRGRALWGRGAAESAGASRGAPPGARCPWHTATTALVLAPLVFGFLGARADAAYGRLRLAPRITDSWPGFRLRGIRLGDVRVELAYRPRGRRHTFGLTPLTGRVPPNLVFEPLVPLRRLRAVRVDGEDADVESYRSSELVGVRLQLPLDSRREVTLEGDAHRR